MNELHSFPSRDRSCRASLSEPAAAGRQSVERRARASRAKGGPHRLLAFRLLSRSPSLRCGLRKFQGLLTFAEGCAMERWPRCERWPVPSAGVTKWETGKLRGAYPARNREKSAIPLVF